jgi:phospholipid-binding lipoprotein MlaA
MSSTTGMTSSSSPVRLTSSRKFLGSAQKSIPTAVTSGTWSNEPETPVFSSERLLRPDVEQFGDMSDPLEAFNKTMYRFNYRLDKYVLLPLVIGYYKVTPKFFRAGVHNFFTNFRNITVFFNSVLQFSGRKSGQTAGRFAVNSTIGLAGLFDPATVMGIPQHDEDFGQTLGRWGVGTGAYLVLPLIGPSNVRDSVGFGVDWYVNNWARETLLDPSIWWRRTWTFLYIIDTRAHVRFLYYGTGSPFEYRLVRQLYTTKRRLDIEK